MQSVCRTVLIVGAVTASLVPVAAAPDRQDALPASISDAEFWNLIERSSEAPGLFPSGNPLSNDLYVSSLAAALASRARPGGAYLGVGREQNFTYIAATRPDIAFITDIHRRNLYLQLLYKALFELSADRADFVSRLFSKPRPDGLTTDVTAARLIEAYWHINTSPADVYRTNLQQITEVLVKTHALPLSMDHLSGIEEVYYAFYWYGPSISYTVGRRYADLMIAVDGTGKERSFLATEEAFQFVKSMQARNLIVPIVADMAGPKALRAVGAYLRQRQAAVRSFYVAGVPASLGRMGLLRAFCANLATMPIDRDSVMLRPDPPEPATSNTTSNMFAEMASVLGIAGAARVSATMNQAAADWAAAAVAPLAEELKRCQ